MFIYNYIYIFNYIYIHIQLYIYTHFLFIILTFQGYNLTFLDILYYSIINTIIVIIISIFIIFTRVDERTFRAYKTGSSKGCTQ